MSLGNKQNHREQGVDYRESDELSWCLSWSNSLCGLVHCPGGNATDPIWRVLTSSDWTSCWTQLKHQHSNPNPNSNPLANQLWSIDYITPPTPLIIPHRLPAFLESLLSLKNCCYIYARCSESSLKNSIRFSGIFPSLKQNFIAYRSSKLSSRPDCNFEIQQLWQSGFSRVYCNSCCSCSLKLEIINIGQSSHEMCSNNILNFQELTTFSNAHTINVWKLIVCPSYIYIYIYIYIYVYIILRGFICLLMNKYDQIYVLYTIQNYKIIIYANKQ